MSTPNPYITDGFTSDGNFTSLVTGGMPAIPLGPIPNPTTTNFPLSAIPAANATTNLDPSILSSLRDVNGNPVIASPNTSIDLGQGKILNFDSASLSAKVTPVLDPTHGAATYTDGEAAFSGGSCRVIIEIPHTPNFNGSSVKQSLSKQLLEITALTVSVHRAKSQVRPFGYINPKGIARGSRTIAGTIILNRFTADVLYRFLQSGLMADLSKDTHYNKLDQLPPFNITMLFSNEQGFISSQSLYNVEFVTDGSVASVNDILLEQTLTYFATDLTPLVPLNFNTLFSPSTTQSGSSATERTVSSLWKTVSA
jgi:hypothetical protein